MQTSKTTHNLDAERGLIGSVLIGGKKILSEVIDKFETGDLYDERHRLIWNAIKALNTKNTDIDAVSLGDELAGYCDKIGGMGYIVELMNRTPNYKHINSYCDIIKRKSMARQKIQQCLDTIQALEEEENPIDVITRGMIADSNIITSQGGAEIVHVKDLALEVLNDIENRKDNNGIVGQGTGFSDFDNSLGGFRRGNFHLIAARPAMGKTTFVLNIARNIAFKMKLPVLFISLEMTKQQLVEKLINIDTGIDSKRIQNAGCLTEEEWQKITFATNNLYNSRLYIDDSHRSKASEIAARARRFKAQNPDLAMIIIDYIQIMKAESRTGKNYEVGETSGILQGLAKELDIPIVALSQLSRDVERRDDKTPTLADLRDSGSLEQDAATVSFLYRDDYYHPEKYPAGAPSIVDLIIAKNRFGSAGKIGFAFQKEKSRFMLLTTAKNVTKNNKMC